MATTPVSDFLAVTLDASDAARLGRFYAELTGGTFTDYPEHGFAEVEWGAVSFNFQTAADYRRPEWPSQEQPQQSHLDFRVTDMDAAIALATALGATLTDEQPGGDMWRVMLDPDGHPFCLCAPPSAAE